MSLNPNWRTEAPTAEPVPFRPSERGAALAAMRARCGHPESAHHHTRDDRHDITFCGECFAVLKKR